MLKRANRRAMEEMAQTLQHAGRDLPRHQDRQGLHQRAAGAQAVPPPQQGLLPQGDEDRPLRFALAPASPRSWASSPSAWRCWPGPGWCSRAKRTLAGHPHERSAAGPRARCLLFYGLLAGVADPVRKFSDILQPPARRRGGQRPDLRPPGPRAGDSQPEAPRPASAGTTAIWSSTA